MAYYIKMRLKNNPHRATGILVSYSASWLQYKRIISTVLDSPTDLLASALLDGATLRSRDGQFRFEIDEATKSVFDTIDVLHEVCGYDARLKLFSKAWNAMHTGNKDEAISMLLTQAISRGMNPK